ncbi:MAG: hypothetical protein K9J27_04160 [Bacteroidales bacterium]|nr:hypothetical protein [Bacteroidales bacterium]MCF8334611.1 hypothetical protein [Bacteroidales bacterium]
MRNLLTFIAITAFISLSSAFAGEPSSNVSAPQGETPEININDFEQKAGEYVGQEVHMEGMVVHVCKHGGKRMFITGDNPDVRVKITKGENMASFKPELEGSDVAVEGVVRVREVSETYLDKWEKDVKADMKESKQKIHTGEEGHEEHEGEKKETLMKIKNMRKQLKESDKDVLSFYSLECKDYKEIK